MLLTLISLFGAVFTRPMERVSTMDAAFAQSLYDTRAIQLVYETPLEIDYYARPYRLVPGYCELPEISADRLSYTFHTHGPARYMVESLERLRNPKLVSPNGWIMKSVDSIRAIDDKTVVVKLKERCHFFPWLMAMTPCAIRDDGEKGTGAFELADWRKNHEMVFKRRDGVKGGFDEVRYLVIDDVSTQWLMFLKGEIDFLGEISRDNFDSVVDERGQLDPKLAAKGIRLHTVPTMDVMHIGFNMNDSVLGKNRKLRQALSCAFNFPVWERFYSGRVIVADGPVPPGVNDRLEAPFAYSYNLEKAKRLLNEAGYPNGIDPRTGRRLTLTLSIGRASQASREQGELIASFFERIGVKLELDFQTWDAFLKAVNEGRFQLFSMGWVGDYPDAQNFLQLFHSRNVSPGPNHAGYTNPEFDAEYDAAMSADTDAERRRHWLRCQEIVREDCPWIFTHYNRSFSLAGPRVGNYVPSVFPAGGERFYQPK